MFNIYFIGGIINPRQIAPQFGFGSLNISQLETIQTGKDMVNLKSQISRNNLFDKYLNTI